MSRGLESKPGGSTLTQRSHEGATGVTPGKRTLTEQLSPYPQKKGTEGVLPATGHSEANAGQTSPEPDTGARNADRTSTTLAEAGGAHPTQRVGVAATSVGGHEDGVAGGRGTGAATKGQDVHFATGALQAPDAAFLIGHGPAHTVQQDAGALTGRPIHRQASEQRTSAQAHVVDDLVMEQIAHRIAYLDGDLPIGKPPEERVRDGDAEDDVAKQGWTEPHRAHVDSLDRRALSDLGFATDSLEFFSGQAGLQFWLLPARPGAAVTPIIAFRGTASVMDLAEDVNGVGIGMGQFTMNQAVIEAAVRRIARGRGAVATGHSLGGALAQIAACFYPDAIVSVVTFQSPGIPRQLVDRLRALPPDQRPTARHHRVDGDLVDEAGEDFVSGPVTLHGGGVDPLTAHTTFPVLSQQQREADDGTGWVPAFARGKVHPEIGSTTRSGTTDNPGFGRPLAGTGLAEAGRRNPITAGATLLGGLGAAGGPLLGSLGTIAGAVGGAYLANKVEPDEVYARIWLNVLEHAEAGDYDFLQLKWGAIEGPCTSEGHKEHIHPMMLNLIQMYPEYLASQHVAEHQPESLRDVASFIAAVRALVPSLSPAAVTRLRTIFPRYKR